MSRLLQCVSGVAAVEFALVFPLFVMLVVGIYVVGAVMYSISSVGYALEETARMLQMNPALRQSDLQAAIDKKLEYFGKEAVTLTMTVEKDGSGSSIARLTATYPYIMAVPFVPEHEGYYQQTSEVFLVISP